MNNTTVDRAKMQVAGGQVDDCVNAIKSNQTTLAGEITSLMGRWQGNASKAFKLAYDDFDAQFGKVQAQLAKIQGELVGSQKTYVQTEDTTTSLSDEITAALAGA